jgi:TonB family protein
MAREKPEVIGMLATIFLHGIVAIVFALIIVDVNPMTSPPIEVEFFGFDEAAPHATEDISDPRETEVIPVPAIHDEHRLVTPVLREEDQPLPMLPLTDPVDNVSIPPLTEREDHKPLPSPSSRIAPIPIEAERDSSKTSRVQVRLEGLLSTRRLIHMVKPAFPPDVPIDGEVKIHLQVASDGAVEMARVVQKAHPRFDESAVRAVRQWRFAHDDESTIAEGNVTIYFRVK